MLQLLAIVVLPAVASATIQWGNCSSDVPLNSPALQCAQLSVPLNWTDPSGQNITLGLTRVKATNSSGHIGSLFVNPGGPGVPASQLTAGQALGFPFFPPNISSKFDIIGVDPRGVGLSGPVMCDPDIWNRRNTLFPTTQQEYDDMNSHYTAVWESCYNLSGPLLYNIDTVSVAKDFEAVRVALDDGPMNLLGISYGSVIAQTYAQLYPDSYRTIAMDAVVDHNSSATNLLFAEAQTYESTVHRFAEWCNTTNTTTCPLYGRDVISIFTELVANATEKPLSAPGCANNTDILNGGCYANITGEEILSVTQDLLLFKPADPPISNGWQGLAQIIALAVEGNGTAYSQAYAASTLATSNMSSTFAASIITCLDFNTEVHSFADLQYSLRLASYVAPITRGSSQTWQTQTQCITFPGGPRDPQRDMSIKNGNGTAGILIAASKYDPSCSYLWAENTRAGIQNVSLVLRNGDGHTSYLLQGEAYDVINDYFLTASLPPNNTVVST